MRIHNPAFIIVEGPHAVREAASQLVVQQGAVHSAGFQLQHVIIGMTIFVAASSHPRRNLESVTYFDRQFFHLLSVNFGCSINYIFPGKM
jgi:hypothetical protein